LDYGMMGVLPADTRTELVALLVNFVNKDEVKV
jgi:predicted unusual protein kinase regulating ubiquinone biosynthesis (AarF/ABC1/UbiB family)